MNLLLYSKQFVFLILIWVGLGVFFPIILYAVIPFTIYLLAKKKRYIEILLGFFVILILSDSLRSQLSFADDLKDIYLLIISLIYILNTKDFPIRSNLINYFVVFFVISFFLMFFSPIYFVSFQKLISYVLLILVISNYALNIYMYDKVNFCRSYISIGLIVLLVGLIGYVANWDFVLRINRYSGIFGNPNGIGIFCVIFYMVFKLISFENIDLFTSKEKIIFHTIIIISLILCGSRASIFGLILFIISAYIYKTSFFFGFIFTVLFVFVYDLISSNLILIFTALGIEKYFRVETLKEGSGRVIAWAFAWENISKNYFLGKGIGYTEYLYKLNYHKLSKLGHEGNAHNSFLTFWLDTGIMGLFSYLAGLITYIFKASKKNILAFPILYTVLFVNLYESWLTASLNPFTIQFVILLAILVVEEHPSEDSFFNTENDEE